MANFKKSKLSDNVIDRRNADRKQKDIDALNADVARRKWERDNQETWGLSEKFKGKARQEKMGRTNENLREKERVGNWGNASKDPWNPAVAESFAGKKDVVRPYAKRKGMNDPEYQKGFTKNKNGDSEFLPVKTKAKKWPT